MKLLTTITLGLITTTSLFAQTTMCFKEDHKSMTTIENTALDGGECNGTLNTKEMKANGWSVDDIKITTNNGKYNFIYIFKKNQTQSNFSQLNRNANITDAELENRILKKLEAKKIQEEKEIEIERVLKNKLAGRNLYIGKCQSCHGEEAKKKPYNTSRALINLSKEEIEESIRDYSNDDKDGGYAMVMKPYANLLTKDKIEQVYQYIQTLKIKKSK